MPNTVADVDYYGRDGKILIKSGVLINETLLNAIFRRNIARFFIQEEGEDIKKLLQLQELDAFDLESTSTLEDDNLFETSPEKVTVEIPVSREKALPILVTIKKGEEGFKQILKSQSVQSLEEAIEKSSIPLNVAISGTPVKEIAQEKEFGTRSQEYKKELVSDYDKSLAEVKQLFIRIRNGKSVSGTSVLSLVKDLIKTYLNDKHMLLNLANVKTKETDYIYAHSLNVSLISIAISASRGFNHDQLKEVGIGALLHDTGALFIPDEIRFKKEPLNKDEIFEIQKHPMLGIHAIERIKGIPEIIQFICYQSHERENREGYPKQRNSRLIHDYAKIVSVADVYDSLTSERPYRVAIVPYKAMEYILKAVKQGLFNAEIVKYYLEYSSLFPVGSLVKLTTGEIGKVIKPNTSQYARPVISVIINNENRLLNDSEVLIHDLGRNHDIKILQAIDNNKLNIDVMKGF